MSVVLSIPVLPPFPWRTILAYLSHRCTPGVETIGADRYVRETPSGLVSVEYDSSVPALRCSVPTPLEVSGVLQRIERLFDPRHDSQPVARVLGNCPLLNPRVAALPGLRAPGCWAPFELCLRVILGQQVSVKAAHTLMSRLCARSPGLEPRLLAETDLATLGLTVARQRTIRALAERVAGGAVRFDASSWNDLAAQLQETPGFGPWTLQYLAIRLGRDPDAFPDTDLGLLRASQTQAPRDLQRMAERWRPYRGYAAMYLWAGDSAVAFPPATD